MTRRALARRTALLVAVVGMSSPLGAATISVDFGNPPSGGAPANSPMGAAEVAGVVPVANWTSATGTAATVSGLRNDAGAATTAAVSYNMNENWSTDTPDTAGNQRMMRSYLNSTAGNSVLNVSGVPYPTYDVYIYSDSADNPRPGTWTLTGATAGNASGSFTDPNPAGADFTGTFTEGQNYVVLRNVSGANFTLTGARNDGPSGNLPGTRVAVNGIQINEVPEPGSAGLLAAATASLLLARRRRA